MIARLSIVTAFAISLLAPSAASAQRFRYPSTCGGGCAFVSAYYDHGGRDWACGGIRYGGHRGTDFAMARGREIVAGATGTVTRTADGHFDACTTGRCSGTNMVTIRHDDGSTSEYLHMMRGSVAVRVGERVGCGQLIGRVASSGQSTGNHLHFHFWPPGGSWSARVDPFHGGCSGTSRSYWVDQGAYGSYSFPAQRCSEIDEDGDGSPRGMDCDDHDARRAPGRAEGCDDVDNDCDERVDEDVSRACGTDVGECQQGTERCASGVWGACDGSIDPVIERCDTLDNDCDGESDDDQVCEHEEVELGAAAYGDGTHSDVDGDGRADACARSSRGFACLMGSEHGFAGMVRGPAMSEGDWAAPSVYSTLRTGDVDGDGRADVCARSGDQLVCWRASGDGFDERVLVAPIGEVAPGARTPQIALADVDGDGADDVCVRDADGLRCHRASPLAGSATIVLGAMSDEGGFESVIHHGSLRMGDVNGDGRADVCARPAEGVVCWLSEGEHFGRRVLGPAWSDALGWSELRHWSTIRLVDVDGDGRADVCGRGPEGFRCHLSQGDRFGGARLGPSGDDAAGWSDPSVFTTLRMGDLDGDACADLCVREATGVRCWLWTGEGFGRQIVGPPLADGEGWSEPTAYRSVRLADIDGDGRADLCARAADGLRCYTSHASGFDRLWVAPAWSDAEGFSDPATSATIRIAGIGASSFAANEGCGCRAVGTQRAGRAWSGLLVVLALCVARRRRRAGRERESGCLAASESGSV